MHRIGQAVHQFAVPQYSNSTIIPGSPCRPALDMAVPLGNADFILGTRAFEKPIRRQAMVRFSRGCLRSAVFADRSLSLGQESAVPVTLGRRRPPLSPARAQYGSPLRAVTACGAGNVRPVKPQERGRCFRPGFRMRKRPEQAAANSGLRSLARLRAVQLGQHQPRQRPHSSCRRPFTSTWSTAVVLRSGRRMYRMTLLVARSVWPAVV